MSSAGALKIKSRSVIYILAFFLIFEPMSISSQYPTLHTIWEDIRYAYYVVIILLYFLQILRHKFRTVDYLVICIFIFYLMQIASTVYNIILSGTSLYGSSIYAIVADAFNAFGMIATLYFMLRRDYRSTIEALAFVLAIYSIINFIGVLAYPTGYYDLNSYGGYFLGDKNNHITMTLVGTFVCILNALERKGRVTFFAMLVTIVNFLSAALTGSFTTLYASLVMIIGMILIMVKKDINNVFKKAFGVPIIFCLIVVVFGASNWIGNIVGLITSRTITFYTRFETWGEALALIKNHIILGNGYIDKNQLLKMIGGSHTHNYYLECLLIGGIILLIVWLAMFHISFSKIDDAKSIGVISKGKHILFASVMCAIMLACVFEAYIYFRNFFIVFVICRYILADDFALPRKRTEKNEVEI